MVVRDAEGEEWGVVVKAGMQRGGLDRMKDLSSGRLQVVGDMTLMMQMQAQAPVAAQAAARTNEEAGSWAREGPAGRSAVWPRPPGSANHGRSAGR